MKKSCLRILSNLVIILFLLSGCGGGSSGGVDDTGTPAGITDNSVFYGAYEETVGIGICDPETRIILIGNDQSRKSEENYVYLPQDRNDVSYLLDDENISISVSDHAVSLKKSGDNEEIEFIFNFSSDYNTVQISGLATATYAGECGGTISGNATKVGSFAEDGTILIRELLFSDDSLSLSVQEGRTLRFQGIRIDTNSETGTDYHLSADAPWLSLTPESGSTSEELTVLVNAVGLSPGVYTATITGTASGYVRDTVDIKLSVTDTPELVFTKNRIDFTCRQGSSITPEVIDIQTNNSTAAFYSITTDVTWLTITPDTGSTPSNPEISVDATGLLPGVYTATITGSASGYEPDTVTVTLTVTVVPELKFEPDTIEYTLQEGTNSSFQIIQIDTNNSTSANYILSDDASWLTLSSGSGNTPGNITVSVDTDGLVPGVYTATITGAASGYVSDTVDVTLTVTVIPAIVITPDTLSFTVNQGGGVETQTIRIDTNNSTVTGYTISEDATWLSVLPITGSTPGNLEVSIDVTGLSKGSYSATITASASGYIKDTSVVSLTVSDYQLQASSSPDRTSPMSLDSGTVSGDIYVFSTPDTGVSSVSFYLDDPGMAGDPVNTDSQAPFDYAGTTPGAYYEEAGIISIEAEHYYSKVTQGGHDWTLVTPAGYSGSGAMQCTPNSGANLNTGYVTTSPRLDYQVEFLQTGTYYVWLRGSGASGDDDSVHVGLNGAAVSTSDRMAGFSSAWTWSQATMDGPVATINISSAGVHTVNVWMREDGFVMDKLVLTKSSSCPVCSGTDPAETVATTPFDTKQLVDGSHEITASIVLESGETVVVTAAFTVTNNTVSLPVVDDFSDGNANGWTTISDSGGSSAWQVISNQYRQTAPFGGSTFDGSYHTGLYAYLTSSFGLANYRFRGDLTPLGEQCNDIGVMFRYTDDDNYYRLSFNARYGFTRLEKKVGGVFYPIANNARGYTKGQAIHVEIVLIGSLIHITVDGDSLFGVYDTSLSTGSVALYTQEEASFDNISIDNPLSDPEIVLATPLAHSVTTSGNLILSAIAYNMPPDRAVKFFLNGTECESVTESPAGVFSSECYGVLQGNYPLEAVLYDNGTSVASDTNAKVAARGEYVVAFGDSITNGSDDNYALDNRSINGEIISVQGYEANLTDLMTTNLNIPTIVYNEGIPGDDTYNANFIRIDSVLERHNGVNRVLILLGTNDSGKMLPVESGLGCIGTACNGTYKGNMQLLINKVIAAGAFPIVALVPPSFEVADPLSSDRNQLIQEYNTVIKTELTGIQIGPDFFSFFLNEDDNFSSLFVDEVHPNGLGYVVMAYLWYNSLSAVDIEMPYLLYDLVPSGYKQNILEAGDVYYTDAPDYTITSIPAILEYGIWINTANVDLDNTDDNHISFTTDREIRVYIAYDGGASILPDWMSGYTDSGVNLSTTNPSAPLHRLYWKDYPAGNVTLGGNLAGGATGADANYVVIVKEN